MNKYQDQADDPARREDELTERKVYAFLKSMGWVLSPSDPGVEPPADVSKPKETGHLSEVTNCDRQRPPRSRVSRLNGLQSEVREGCGETEQNLARAARDGGAITPEVEAQMRRDREEAERRMRERDGG